eukprot:CAMPEP_0169278550 /NCGR_PEP_ID=MMETSP1016-20121227/54393_1 /TAXON_ID=342587 /ORGANISM="Karlodinium micrum, Strain CCMP2283" /LENGTH=120 /DNA_ID=CAMNT_0009366335 /DNA_START=81 /DNA_END=443 /DNA_ORIENTATION=+
MTPPILTSYPCVQAIQAMSLHLAWSLEGRNLGKCTSGMLLLLCTYFHNLQRACSAPAHDASDLLPNTPPLCPSLAREGFHMKPSRSSATQMPASSMPSIRHDPILTSCPCARATQAKSSH